MEKWAIFVIIYCGGSEIIKFTLNLHIICQPALATSLDLRCYLCLTLSQDGQITLNAPDLDLRRTWSVADITHKLKLQTIVTGDIDSSSDEKQLESLKDLTGIERGEEVPATPAVATLVFLFLLVNIYGIHFKWVLIRPSLIHWLLWWDFPEGGEGGE